MGGGHHDHHHAPYKVPDYSIYKIENYPRLVEFEKKLASKGLKDPWLRNEAWRFNPAFPSIRKNAFVLMTRGLGTGIVLCFLTYGYKKVFVKEDPHAHH